MNDKNIPSFTKEEYLTSTEPFEWLENNSSNQFERFQKIELMSAAAKRVGVNNFKKLYKLYTDSKKEEKNGYMLNATGFEGQELQLDSGRWTCDDFGVTAQDRYGNEIVACPHPIMPVQRLINIDTNTEKLKIAYKKGEHWRSIIIDKKTLASNNQIISLADFGVAVNSNNSKYLVEYITDIEAMNYDRIPELNSVGRLGWINEYDFSPYVDKLVFDGEASFKHFFESVKSVGNFEKWKEVARTVRASKSIPAKIMLSASFASCLVEPVGALPFFVHLWGNTEGGKTVALMLAASVWANPRMGEYAHSFNGTGVAQELSAGFVNSLPLILDELQIVKEKKDFDQMIYQLTEGVGRQRGAKTGGLQKVSTWNNCILTSGEMPLSCGNSGGGAINRIINVEYSDAIFSDPVYVAETIKKNYGYAGRMFIEAISDDKVIDEIKTKQKEYLKVLQQSESTDKQSMSASLILVADFFAERYIFRDGNNLTVEDIKPFLSTKTDVSQELKAYEYLLDTISINSSRFLPKARDINGEVWGQIDPDCAYIITTKFNEILKNEGFNPTSTLSWLKKNELIEYNTGRRDKVKKVNGICRKCICLKLVDTYEVQKDFNNWEGIKPKEHIFGPKQESFL